jgi:glycerophosphoryl diester phosphodiesterase
VQAVCPYFVDAIQHPEQVARAHQLGKFVFIYTANEEEHMRRLVEAGVDGMVSDRPALLLQVFGS